MKFENVIDIFGDYRVEFFDCWDYRKISLNEIKEVNFDINNMFKNEGIIYLYVTI